MKDKLLNILLISILFVLILNLFTDPAKQDISTGVYITTDSSYTLPASPKLTIKNDSDKDITINTCSDINLKHDGEIMKFDDDFCKDLTIKTKTSEIVNYGSYFKEFYDINSSYYFSVLIDGKEKIANFNVENKGFFNKFFSFFFYAPLYNLTAFLIEITGNSLGWAIIIVTALIRLILVFPQHKMMVSQRKLQAIQPKIKNIQEKFKGNQQMLGVELMKLYKEEKVNPMGSCGFLLIQMPILIVIYQIIISIQDIGNTFYLYNFMSSFHVESMITNFYGLDLLATGGVAGIILAISVGAIQFIQVKLSLVLNKDNKKSGIVLEKKKGSSDYSSMMPDPEFMNKFMLYGMPLMVGIFTYTFFAGVGIYWGISTLFMTIQQLVVNKIVKK